MKEKNMGSQFVLLSREFFERDTITVSREVLGKSLVRITDQKTLVARIVDVEAYIGEYDPAAHASSGRTKRTDVLYREAGHAYIFQTHGYNCLNFVAEPLNSPGCILVRAIQPLVGIEQMKRFRGKETIKDTEIANGPGKLCKALNIDISLYGTDLVNSSSPLQVCEDLTMEKFEVQISKRIGITKATDWELRFTVKDSIFMSR